MNNKSNNNINFYGNATGVQIQQCSTDSKQRQKYTVLTESNVEEYQAILDQISKFQSQFKDEFGEKSEELIEALNQAQAALERKDDSMWKKALCVIRDIATGVTGSLIATGILGLIMPAL